MSNHDEEGGQSLECGRDQREKQSEQSPVDDVNGPAASVLIGFASAADIIRHLMQHSPGKPALVIMEEPPSGGRQLSGGKLPKARAATAAGKLIAGTAHTTCSIELMGANAAAAMCGVGRTHWYEMRRAGRVPLPHRLGRRVLWNVSELREWIAAGLPPLHQWNRIKDQNKATLKRKG